MKIIAYKKININEYLIKLQNHSEIKLYDDTIIKFDLLLLKGIDENKLKEIIDYNNTLSAYFLAIKYLTKKQRCKKETSDYLIKKEFSKNTIELVIKRLEKEGYINDIKYVNAYINDQINLTLNGPNKIKQNLKKLNIKEDIISERIEQIDDEIFTQKIEKIVEKRIKTNKKSNQIFKNELKNYLLNQGYLKEQFSNIVNNINIDDNTNFFKKANILYKKLIRKYEGNELKMQLKNKLYMQGFSLEQINNYIESITTN